MKIEMDSREETAKFVVDGHALDVNSIDGAYNASVDSERGLSVTVTFRPDEFVHTDRRGVTVVAKADGSMTFSGTDRAAVREAAGLSAAEAVDAEAQRRVRGRRIGGKA